MARMCSELSLKGELTGTITDAKGREFQKKGIISKGYPYSKKEKHCLEDTCHHPSFIRRRVEVGRQVSRAEPGKDTSANSDAQKGRNEYHSCTMNTP